jgi:hypothetical protein
MAGKAGISLTTGLEDSDKVTVVLLVAVGAAESGRPTLKGSLWRADLSTVGAWRGPPLIRGCRSARQRTRRVGQLLGGVCPDPPAGGAFGAIHVPAHRDGLGGSPIGRWCQTQRAPTSGKIPGVGGNRKLSGHGHDLPSGGRQ